MIFFFKKSMLSLLPVTLPHNQILDGNAEPQTLLQPGADEGYSGSVCVCACDVYCVQQ